VNRTLVAVALATLASLSGCSKSIASSPEKVADGFVEAYFVRADQEKAKEFTALGATKMLEDELREVGPIRKEGYDPSEARGEVFVHRGESSQREQRVRFPYQITIRAEGVETVRNADIELTQIQGGWKVVRVGLGPTPGPDARSK
jgi:hypothetical protein